VSSRSQLQDQIGDWWHTCLREKPQLYWDPSVPLLGPEIDERDAYGFLRGLEEHLFWVDEGDLLLSELRPRTRAGKLTRYGWFDNTRTGGAC